MHTNDIIYRDKYFIAINNQYTYSVVEIFKYFSNLLFLMPGESELTRRDSLKVIGAGATLNISAINGDISNRKVTLATHKIGDDVVKTKEVPTKWWQQMRTAKSVYKKITTEVFLLEFGQRCQARR